MIFWLFQHSTGLSHLYLMGFAVIVVQMEKGVLLAFSFQFASNGDLIDVGGTAATNDGDDWVAFSRDCQAYGAPKYAKDSRKRGGCQHEAH